MVKIPRFQLEKFPGADPRLTTQMKSVGEAMAIGRIVQGGVGQGCASLELDATPGSTSTAFLSTWPIPPERLAYIYAALRRGFSADEIALLTHIDRWFLTELEQFVRVRGATA